MDVVGLGATEGRSGFGWASHRQNKGGDSPPSNICMVYFSQVEYFEYFFAVF